MIESCTGCQREFECRLLWNLNLPDDIDCPFNVEISASVMDRVKRLPIRKMGELL
ncbi:hypothetical protein LCGC14_1590480 [marine sediment metagenome]|uniref:Uncharacterized protein n=1 Tax=marine sediment metagenome TaxID=412755 RepID=A0A0F9IE17_9ZZZZ